MLQWTATHARVHGKLIGLDEFFLKRLKFGRVGWGGSEKRGGGIQMIKVQGVKSSRN